MSKLDELIQQLCPDGVEWKTLNDIGEFFGGLTGKSKNDFIDGNAAFITYSNIYSNPSLNLNIDEKVRIDDGEKQNVIQYGDILFTGSSETPDECGMSSVVTKEPTEKMYLNSFCFGLRLFELDKFNFDYLKHLFRSAEIRKEICKTANGVTRFNVSKKKMGEIAIPLPPLPVQEEIVRILDTFTESSNNLKEQIQMRRKQYVEYRSKLLDIGMQRQPLKDLIVKGYTGATPLKSKTEYYENGTIPWLRTQEVCFNDIYSTDCFITEEALNKTSVKWIPANCVIVAISGATAGRCAINKIPLTTNQHCLSLDIDKTKAIYKFVYYCMCRQNDELTGKKEGARGDLNVSKVLGLKIPCPTLSEQQRIVSILDQFEASISNLELQLKLRKKQYEYYRNQLLDFKKKED